MEITRPYDNDIIVIKDFLAHSESNLLSFFVQHADDEEWSKANWEVSEHLHNKTINFTKSEARGVENIRTLCRAIDEKAGRVLREAGILDDSSKILGFNQVIRISDHGMDEHSDASEDSENPILYGLICYFSNEFTGGELEYTNLGIKHAPEKNELVIHPATDKYKHKVNDVTSGTRYAMTTFIVPA